MSDQRICGFVESASLALVSSYLKEHGPVLAIHYDRPRDMLLVCLPSGIVPYCVTSKTWSAPIEIQGEFIAATTVNDKIVIATTMGIFQLGG